MACSLAPTMPVVDRATFPSGHTFTAVGRLVTVRSLVVATPTGGPIATASCEATRRAIRTGRGTSTAGLFTPRRFQINLLRQCRVRLIGRGARHCCFGRSGNCQNVFVVVSKPICGRISGLAHTKSCREERNEIPSLPQVAMTSHSSLNRHDNCQRAPGG